MEIFPVEIALRGEAIWLGWVSPDDGDEFFLTHNGCLIFSCDGKDGLTQEVVKVLPDAKLDVESFFDFDSVVERLDSGVVLEDDFALNIWNLLTDLYHTFGGSDKIFFESHLEVYSRLFSQSEVAPLVDVQKVQLSTHDKQVVREVLLEGVELLIQKIRIAKMARSH